MLLRRGIRLIKRYPVLGNAQSMIIALIKDVSSLKKILRIKKRKIKKMKKRSTKKSMKRNMRMNTNTKMKMRVKYPISYLS